MQTLTRTAATQLSNRIARNEFITQEVVLPGVVEPDGLQLRERKLAAPLPGQATVRVEATGISFAEQSMRRGRYPLQPKFPFVPGYDLVGIVEAVGAGVDPSLVGTRVAALTKTGGWSTYASLSADTLLPVPHSIDPAEAEALVVNGITAWQLLHRQAKIRRSQTIVVHGANGGVGTILTQLALHAGVRVIGLASPRHHQALQAQGVEPVDYNDPEWAQRIRAMAPNGVDAVFDNIGGAGVAKSFGLLRRNGMLVCYAIASVKNGKQSLLMEFLLLLAQLTKYNLMPNGRKAGFYNIWGGKGRRAFLPRMKEDFMHVMMLLADGVLTPRIAARFPLAQISDAMKLAESRTVYGKVILLPEHDD